MCSRGDLSEARIVLFHGIERSTPWWVLVRRGLDGRSNLLSRYWPASECVCIRCLPSIEHRHTSRRIRPGKRFQQGVFVISLVEDTILGSAWLKSAMRFSTGVRTPYNAWWQRPCSQPLHRDASCG